MLITYHVETPSLMMQKQKKERTNLNKQKRKQNKRGKAANKNQAFKHKPIVSTYYHEETPCITYYAEKNSKTPTRADAN